MVRSGEFSFSLATLCFCTPERIMVADTNPVLNCYTQLPQGALSWSGRILTAVSDRMLIGKLVSRLRSKIPMEVSTFIFSKYSYLTVSTSLSISQLWLRIPFVMGVCARFVCTFLQWAAFAHRVMINETETQSDSTKEWTGNIKICAFWSVLAAFPNGWVQIRPLKKTTSSQTRNRF